MNHIEEANGQSSEKLTHIEGLNEFENAFLHTHTPKKNSPIAAFLLTRSSKHANGII